MPRTKQLTAVDKRLRKEYGITLDQYNAVLAMQSGCCAICKRPAQTFKVRLSVDHCHTTGLLRGLLCNFCNRALAKFNDSIAKLHAAAHYLLLPPITQYFGTDKFTVPGRVGSKKRNKALKLLSGGK